MHSEKVTVLLPFYNAGPYLKEAVQSIINQTFTDYTLLLINDGSTDKSEDIIKELNDARIWYIKHDTNVGLITTLNQALSLAQSKYIVRMDADDISAPERLEKQVLFMESNPDIDISGTWFSEINTTKVISHPVTNEECKVKLLKNTTLGHPTVILRRESIIQKNLSYDERALYAEDYKFWADATVSGLKIANIPQVLLHYRIHPEQISTAKAMQQSKTIQNINLWYGQQFFNDLLKNKLNLYAQLLNSSINNFKSFIEVKQLVNQLKTENRSKSYFDIAIFENFMDNLLRTASMRIYILCLDCNLKILWRSFFDKHFYESTSMFQKAKFIFKSIYKTLF
ncbi:MAG: epsE 1 [Mucilaginibacter sp.]|nr:epsE 1 [Mucilaginibacter sp.]